MAYDNENVFAKILRGELPCDKVYENDHALAFKDIQPQAPVHILVIPKGPYVSLDDFSENASDAEVSGFFRAVGQVARDACVVETIGDRPGGARPRKMILQRAKSGRPPATSPPEHPRAHFLFPK